MAIDSANIEKLVDRGLIIKEKNISSSTLLFLDFLSDESIIANIKGAYKREPGGPSFETLIGLYSESITKYIENKSGRYGEIYIANFEKVSSAYNSLPNKNGQDFKNFVKSLTSIMSACIEHNTELNKKAEREKS